jgi:hypothetical protein
LFCDFFGIFIIQTDFFSLLLLMFLHNLFQFDS